MFCFWQLNQTKQIQAVERKEERENPRRQRDFTVANVTGKLEGGGLVTKSESHKSPSSHRERLHRVEVCNR